MHVNRLGFKLAVLALLLSTLTTYPPQASASTLVVPPEGLHGTVMIGDSISWRSEPTIRHRHPDWYVDALRGRPVKALGPRLNHYLRTVNPRPANFVMALGSNRSSEPPWTKRRYLHALSVLPKRTNVLLMLVVRPGRAQEWKDRTLRTYNRWSRQIARDRPNTYLIPWRSVVLRDPTLNAQGRSRLLEDGVHPTGPSGELGRSRRVGHGVDTFVALVERAWLRANPETRA